MVSATPRGFERQMRALAAWAQPVSLAQVRSGRLPRRAVAVTFDDCYRDYLAAARVLAEHGLPACFFIPTGYVGTVSLTSSDGSGASGAPPARAFS